MIDSLAQFAVGQCVYGQEMDIWHQMMQWLQRGSTWIIETLVSSL